MKCLLLAAAFLAASVAAIPHVVTEFSIPLGHEPQTDPSVQFLEGDIFVVVTYSGLAGVNLTSKTSQWFVEEEGGFSSIYIPKGGSNAILVGEESTKAFNLQSGAIAWKTEDFSSYSSQQYTHFATKGDEIAIITQNNLGVLNMNTGNVKANIDLQSSYLSGETLYVVGGAGTISSVNVFTGVASWITNLFDNFDSVLYANDDYVIATAYRETNGGNGEQDTILYVLKAADGSEHLKIDAMNGINEDGGPVTIVGTNLTVIAGFDEIKKYVIDINTGVILSLTPYNNQGNGGAGGCDGGNHCVERSNGDALRVVQTEQGSSDYGEGFKVTSTDSTGAVKTVCAETPSNQGPNLAYLGDGLLKIGNLQGWVFFSIDSSDKCTLITRDETLPNWVAPVQGGQVTKFDGDFIEIQGENVIGYKVVQ